MSLLVAFAGTTPESHAAHPDALRALASARQQGHGEPICLRWDGGYAWWFDTPANPGTGGACVQQGTRFAASVGCAHWQGLSGAPLLQRLLADSRTPGALPWRDFSGGFALLLSDGHGVWLFTQSSSRATRD